MFAWLCQSTAGVGDLRWTELPTPEPRAGQARVAIRAASLNFPDLLIVDGKYQFKPPLPFVPGSEFAGVVEAVGEDGGAVQVGDHVMTTGMIGGFATHAVVDTRQLIRVPAGMPFTDAAAMVLTYGTTHHALIDRARLEAGDTMLVLGAAGGVGTAAIQIGKHLGARVIAAVSTDAKAAFCRTLGADATINYTTEPFRDAIKAATDGRGPDVIYDAVGGPLADPAFRSIGWRGRYLVIGFAAGIPTLPLNLALLKGASIVGVFWGDYVRREPASFAQSVADLAAWYGAGRIKPALDGILPMAQLAEAYRRMSEREAMGKVVLINP